MNYPQNSDQCISGSNMIMCLTDDCKLLPLKSGLIFESYVKYLWKYFCTKSSFKVIVFPNMSVNLAVLHMNSCIRGPNIKQRNIKGSEIKWF